MDRTRARTCARASHRTCERTSKGARKRRRACINCSAMSVVSSNCSAMALVSSRSSSSNLSRCSWCRAPICCSWRAALSRCTRYCPVLLGNDQGRTQTVLLRVWRGSGAHPVFFLFFFKLKNCLKIKREVSNLNFEIRIILPKFDCTCKKRHLLVCRTFVKGRRRVEG